MTAIRTVMTPIRTVYGRDAARTPLYDTGFSIFLTLEANMTEQRTNAASLNAEDAKLQGLGYQPQFKRVLGLFADFSLGYSYMSPMAGLFGLFATALVAFGPPFFWTMWVILTGQLLVCLVFAEAASAYPIAGGVYQWARRIGGARWGFMTAWIYLLALIATAAGIAAVGAPFVASLIGLEATPTFNAVASLIIGVVAIACNLLGTRMLARVTELGVWTGLAGLAICGVYLLVFSRVQPPSVLFDTFGKGEGGYLPGALAASLIGIWIFYGFEACGDMAEEVEDASRVIPRAMILTVVCGGASALLMALGLILAVPDLAAGVSGKVADPASAALVQGVGPVGSKVALLCLIAVVVSATASVLASTSRLLFSLGRDEMIFAHRWIGRLDERHGQPRAAIAVTGVVTLLILSIGLVSTDAGTQIVSFATTGVYTAFQMVVLACLAAGLRGWRPNGSFTLRGSAPLIRVLALVFGVADIANLAWPRTPEQGWFANWLIVISMAVIVITGFLQMLAFVPRSALAKQVAAE